MFRNLALLPSRWQALTKVISPSSQLRLTPTVCVPLQQCSTKSPTSNEPEEKLSVEKNVSWKTVYYLPSIMLTAAIKRLKFYPLVATGVTVPISLGLAYANIWSVATAQVVGAMGVTTTITLLTFSLMTNNLVGFVYADNSYQKVKISYLDGAGRRQDRIYTVDDLVARTELQKSFLRFYFPVKNHENKEVYKLVHRYGEIYDPVAFDRIFGPELD